MTGVQTCALPISKVPPGLSVDGKIVARLRPEGGFDPGEMQRAFGEAMKSGAIPDADTRPAK